MSDTQHTSSSADPAPTLIGRLIQFTLRERLLMAMLAAAIVFFGWQAIQLVPLDAIPNVAENQVIVLTQWPGRSPKDVEDQITYPLSIALQAVPGSESVRGKSMFGFSFVQVTFADGVDFDWARTRVLEQLTTAGSSLPDGVMPQLGPNATPLGQIFYYVLVPPKQGMDLAQQRSIQDYVVKYALQSVDGVAEVASIGGYEKQYQVEVNPELLRYHKLTLSKVIDAVKTANVEVGAKTLESNGLEFILRGKGFIGSGKTETETIDQIGETVIVSRSGIPIRVRDVADLQVGPAFRRGALDYNGGEAVGGVVVMQFGENPRAVIQRVKEKIASLEESLDGVRIKGIYDRTTLINETSQTLLTALLEEIGITVVVILLFLLHLRSSLVVALTLPIAVLIAVIAMYYLGIDANIMSLAGIAIAIGTMVDMAIIVSENIYAHLAIWEKAGRRGGKESRLQVIQDAAAEVIPAVITAVSTTVVSFLPVFLLTGRDHRLFTPLAWTKSFSLIASLIVAVIFVPLLCRLLLTKGSSRKVGFSLGVLLCCGAIAMLRFLNLDTIRDLIGGPSWTLDALVAAVAFLVGYRISTERVVPIESSPLSRLVHAIYAPALRLFLQFKKTFLLIPALICFVGLGAWIGLPTITRPLETISLRLGANLNAVPGYVDAKHVFTGLESDDWIALDEGSWFYMPSLYPAASFSQAMQVLQTQDAMILQIPEVADVLGKIGRVESALDPAPTAMIETYVMLKPRDQWRPGVTERSIWDEINSVATMPGVTPASALQPIEGRVVMLQSGIKASMAIRIYGDSLDGLATAAQRVADQLRSSPVVNAGTVNPDIVTGKPYYEFEVNRKEAARYGMSAGMVNQIVAAGLGGMNVTSTVEGRERYPIQVRFQRDVRSDFDTLGDVPVFTHMGITVPLDTLASLSTSWGPGAINSEDARLVAHVSFSPTGNIGDLETVANVEAMLDEARKNGELKFPAGNFEIQAVGSFENQIEANQRLIWVIPTVLFINLIIIYLGFRNLSLSLAVFTGIPVAFAGGMIMLGIADVQMNTAIWVGFIALFGIAVDDGVVLASYLNTEFSKRQPRTVEAIRAATVDAGLRRIRPCLMTTITTIAALIPVLIATGRGADVARAMALPVFGGMCVELVTLFVVPVVFCAMQEIRINTMNPE